MDSTDNSPSSPVARRQLQAIHSTLIQRIRNGDRRAHAEAAGIVEIALEEVKSKGRDLVEAHARGFDGPGSRSCYLAAKALESASAKHALLVQVFFMDTRQGRPAE